MITEFNENNTETKLEHIPEFIKSNFTFNF